MTLLGIDVALWQGSPDWSKVAASGITFAIAKATEGNSYIDPTYAANAKGIPAAGLIGGAYHWLVGGYGDGAAQADWFHSVVGDLTGRLAMLDIEDPKYPPTTADVDAFIARFRVLYPGHPLLAYGSRYNALGATAQAADGLLWLANYGANGAGTPAAVYAGVGGDASPIWASGFNGWAGPTIWQFGSTGAVPGIAGHVDINAFRGSLAELQALTQTLPTGDAPMPAYKPVGRPLGTFTFDNHSHALIVTTDTRKHIPFGGWPGGGDTFPVFDVIDLKTPSGTPVDIEGTSPPLNKRDQVYLVDRPEWGAACFVLRGDGTFTPAPPPAPDLAAIETARKEAADAATTTERTRVRAIAAAAIGKLGEV